MRDSSVGSASVCVYLVKNVLSSGRDCDMLVKNSCNIHQIYMIKVSRNHKERLRVFILERANVTM